MPELAEVEIVRENLEGWWTSAASDLVLHDDRLLVRGDPVDLERLFISPPPTIRRRGKYLIAEFDDEHVVFHFRMTGKIILCHEPDVDYARLAWHVPDCGWLVFKDSRRLGQVEVFGPGELEEYQPLQDMGPEPEDADPAELQASVSRRKRLKDALLDQSIIAGVGNIAISEVFWRLCFPPDVECSDLDTEDYERLVDELPTYFDDVIRRQRSDEIVYLGEGKSDNPFDVYKREGEPCPRCGTEIVREKFGGRSSYYCPDCQS